jgi:ABC-type transport system involved in multi-copper enzyme maturation permease subunit
MRKFIAAVAMIASVLGFSIAATPANAASAPSILQVSNKKPLPAGGQNITLYGTNLTLVSAVIVDKSTATVVSKAATKLTFITPAHMNGLASISLKYGTKTYVLKDALLYKDSANRVLAPLPYIPETLKVGKTVEMTPGNSAWQVVVTTDTPTVCSIDGLVVKALKKGECSLNIDVNVDTMDRTYRSRSALYFITVN